jgi:hypothetical protein
MIDTSIIVIYHAISLTVHIDVYQYHQDDWYIYHSDLSRLWLYILMCISIIKMIDTSITVIYHISDCTYWCVSVSPRWLIHLSQWFITLCLWLYILMCISIIKMIDTSISHLSRYVSDCTYLCLYSQRRDKSLW